MKRIGLAFAAQIAAGLVKTSMGLRIEPLLEIHIANSGQNPDGLAVKLLGFRAKGIPATPLPRCLLAKYRR